MKHWKKLKDTTILSICRYIRSWMKKKSATQSCVHTNLAVPIYDRDNVRGGRLRYTWGRNTRSMYQLIEINWLNHKTSCLQLNVNVTYYTNRWGLVEVHVWHRSYLRKFNFTDILKFKLIFPINHDVWQRSKRVTVIYIYDIGKFCDITYWTSFIRVLVWNYLWSEINLLDHTQDSRFFIFHKTIVLKTVVQRICQFTINRY